MKTLLLDIETSPNLAHVWGLWNNNVSLNQLMDSTRMLCFAAKWMGEKRTMFFSEWDGEYAASSKKSMHTAAWDLLNEADAVIHYNGTSFDMKHLNREFIEHGFLPPSPVINIDLCNVVKKKFRFPSNKLDYVAGKLLGENKTSHTGHKLWVDVMARKPKALKLMEKYNRQDVLLLEPLYGKLLPWIDNHPNVALINGAEDHACPNCASTNLKKDGKAYTRISVFQRYRCHACGKYSKGNKRLGNVEIA